MSGLNSQIAVIGIDIGKNSFHVVGQDERGLLVLRQKWSSIRATCEFRGRGREGLCTFRKPRPLGGRSPSGDWVSGGRTPSGRDTLARPLFPRRVWLKLFGKGAISR